MRKLLLMGCLVCCIILLSSSPVFAAKWLLFSSNSTAQYYFDAEATGYVTPSDAPDIRYIETWIYEDFRKVKDDGTSYTVQRIWLNLDQKQYAVKAYYKYDVNKYLIHGTTQKGVWKDCLPGTVGEAMYHRVRYYAETKR